MKDLKLRDKVRTLLYMIGMVAVLFMAETTIAYATSDDDALSNSILSEQPVDENRTNIREPGSSENADDLKQLNIANSLTVSYDGGNGELAGTLRILLILTAISLAPILLVTITSFTRILIVLHFTRQALNTTSAPLLIVSLVIGLIVSIFQTVTSIQEQTLTFVPKMVGMFVGLMLLGHWMLNEMSTYMEDLWRNFTIYIR